MEQIFLIMQREFRERVAKKSFIIVTLLMPLLMLLICCLPALIMEFAGTEERTIAVVDLSGEIGSRLKGNESLHFLPTDAPLDSAKRIAEIDGVLYIPSGAVTDAQGITLYTTGPSSMKVEEAITNRLEDIIEESRIAATQIDNLREIMDGVRADVSLQTVRVDVSSDSEESSSSGLSFALGLCLSFILYMFLLIYGQMVMTSIIEEKNNRVLELVVTSVKPVHLMLGKIFGIACVAIVQILIWMVLMCCITAFVLPATLPADLITEVSAAQAGTLTPESATHSMDLIQVVSTLGSVTYVLNMLFIMLVFLVGGYLFYSAIFAAVGSAVDNIQDASQLQTIIVMPIILGIIMSVTVAGDPQSGLGIVCSYIPFTSPMVMMARIPFGVPGWEVWLSFIILMASFVVTAWVAGKIYRVGIFMYGKKPTLKDLWRWARQS